MIRPAIPADANQILAIEERCFSTDRLSPRSIRRFLKSPGSRTFVYVQDKTVAGYILTLCHKRSRLGRHYSVAVLPEYRRRGIAEALLRHAEGACPEKAGFKLEIRKDNTGARRLYSRFGYEVRGVRPGYYADGQDAIEMVKST